MAKELELEAYNRDRGGAQHEKGDVFRADRMEPYISIPLERYLILIAALKV